MRPRSPRQMRVTGIRQTFSYRVDYTLNGQPHIALLQAHDGADARTRLARKLLEEDKTYVIVMTSHRRMSQ